MWKAIANLRMILIATLLLVTATGCSPESLSQPSEVQVGVRLKIVEQDTLAVFYFRDLSETGWLSGSVQAPDMVEMTFCCGKNNRAALLYLHLGSPRQVTIRAWNALGESLHAKWPRDSSRT